jgi:hypothetical protein
MRDRSHWPDDFDGRWSYLSYFPERRPGAGPLDPSDQKLGASGMSIDRAWTHTVGHPDVRIAVLDSGIEWDAADLVNQAALNLGELGRDEARPRDRAGQACGGTGPLAGYDCNADGVFDVSDYRDDPRFAPPVPGEPCFVEHDRSRPGGDRIRGDLNRNCILDPGDLILMFSDGVDGDANGYVDDICGWDFLANDNDPYDDTRSGNGTGQAKGSAAAANNGEGLPGVCPGCRFVPVRVGDSFVVDGNDFAKGVVFAADGGVKVISGALAAVNQTSFAKAAIDYAYRKGSIVVLGIGDESSRHHTMPATANHVLTVHPIRFPASADPASATTFLAFETCSNYGGQLSLSVSAAGCSGEATARAAGIAGLLFSKAARARMELTAEEAIQLFKMEADDIDVAASREPGTTAYFYSQPGFDQRFGYGRANAARMMEAIEAGRIPPEVDIVAPEWFAPVQDDRTVGAIPIVGRVSASRAKSYDVSVQWAPGVQPAEADYRDIVAPLTNLPPGTVTGGATPLAQLDPGQVDPAHAPDPDSRLGENARSISIRVHAVAHYASGDVHGEARRVIGVTNAKNGRDRDLLPGFPLAIGASVDGSPKLADVDGDGVRDIVIGDSSGRLHVLSAIAGAPVELAGFPYLTRPVDGLNSRLSTEPTVPSYLAAPAYTSGATGGVDPAAARETIVQAPAVVDLDGDGRPEIVFATFPGTIYAINGRGQDLPGWPRRLPLVPSCPHAPARPGAPRCMDTAHAFARGTYGAPVVVDMNGDRRPEIVVGSFDGRIWVFRADGAVLDGFPVDLVAPGERVGPRARVAATPTVADLNGDGTPDILSGSNQVVGESRTAGAVFAIDGRGNASPRLHLAGWPVVVESLAIFPLVAEGVVAAQAVADFDGDGAPDVLVQGNGAPPVVFQADPSRQVGLALAPGEPFGPLTKARSPDVMLPLLGQPSIGDIDQDGVPDVVASGGSRGLAAALAGGGNTDRNQHLLAMWSGRTGQMLPGSPVVLEDFTSGVNHAIADVSGDEYPEVITGTGGYFLHAADGCGREAEGFPKYTNGWIAGTAAVGDIDADADGRLDVVVGTRDGWLFAWKTNGRSTGPVEWESFHHDNANTGNVGTALAQGSRTRAAKPLACPVPGRGPDAMLDVGGGCACRAAPRTPPGAAPAAAALGAAALAFRRRRRLV